MADTAVITVQDVKTEDKFSEKTGKNYTTLVIVDSDSEIYHGFVNKDTVVPSPGDTLDMRYQTVTSKVGVRHNIVSFNKAGEHTTQQYKTPTSKNPPWKTTNKDTNNYGKGARVGGIVHDAVALSIHNAALNKQRVSIEDVISTAKALLSAVDQELE